MCIYVYPKRLHSSVSYFHLHPPYFYIKLPSQTELSFLQKALGQLKYIFTEYCN